MRKFLILAFVISSLAGYFTVSRVTTCQAQACPCDFPCIAGSPTLVPPEGSLVQALANVDANVVQPDNWQAQDILEAYFQPLTLYFAQGMLPVMNWTTREITDWINTFWYYNLLPDLQLMTKQLSTADTEQAVELGMFADAANLDRTRRTLDDMAIQDEREQRPSGQVCTAGSMMSGMERANVFSDSYLAYGAADKWWIASNKWGSESANGFANYLQNRWESQRQDASSYGQTVTQGGNFGYIPLWCNNQYNKGYAGCTASGKYVGEDVDVAGEVFGQDTIPLDKQQDPSPYRYKADIDELVTNLAEAFGKNPVSAGTPSEDGILNSLSYRARRQVVYDSLFYVISRRVPGGFRSGAKSTSVNNTPQQPTGAEQFVSLLQAIRKATGESPNTGCGLGDNLNHSVPCTTSDPSRNEIFRALIAQRFQSGQYALSQIDEPENNAREQVVDQALQLMQMNDQMELMDHYSLLLASRISNEIVQGTDFTSASSGAKMK